MPSRRGPKVSDLNPHLLCSICDGYLIDATTISECLHSFCRTCIVRYLEETSNFCPVCDVLVHKTRPLLSIRSDQTLQDLVYKLIPGLHQNEMQKRREFYAEHPEAAALVTPEERGESEPKFFYPQEHISLTLQHRLKDTQSAENSDSKDPTTRHLRCPAAFTVGHLKKFLHLKFSLPTTCAMDIFYDEHLLRDDYSLMDVAYIYSWKRAAPMNFFYNISKRAPKVIKPLPPPEPVPCSEPTNLMESSTEDMVLEMDPVSTVELQKTEVEPQEMDVDLVIVTPEPVEVDNSPSVTKEPVKCEAEDDQKMDVEEPAVVKFNSSPAERCITPPRPIPEPTYNSVKLVSAPERNTLLSPTNGFRLKFIHDPELNPKSQKSKKDQKKSGRKGGRSSRHKSVPVRLARLAPYPPPPATCLTTQPLQHLPQITMGKLVPTVITTLANTIVTTLVSTTSNSLCNATRESNTHQVASFLSQPTTCNVSTVANNFVATVPKIGPEINHIQSSTSTTTSYSHLVNGGTSSASTFNSSSNSGNTKELSNTNLTVPSTCAIIVAPSAPSSSAASAMNVHLKLPNQDSNQLDTTIRSILTTTGEIGLSFTPSSAVCIPTSTVSSPVCIPPSINSNDSKSATADSVSILSHLPTQLSCSTSVLAISETVTSTSGDVSPVNKVPNDIVVTCDTKNVTESTQRDLVTVNILAENDEKTAITLSENKESIFKNSMKEYSENNKADRFSESFKMGVKNSISAEFSDNDDLGCQPDLVVDEQKIDSSDNEDDTSDAALRKKITAIAEKEDEIDVTDDTEADSGVSCATRSEDDIDSPKSSVSSGTFLVTVPSVSIAASPTPSSSTEDNRHAKSNNINAVINQLRHRQHEISRPTSSLAQSKHNSRQCATKCDNGALDLSTCTRKPGEVHPRPKTVANPVLDIKHRQQTYLPAPTNKQHTICPPAPKHNSSPLLLSHLTGSSSILHAQLTGNAKSPHHSSSYAANVPFSISSSRTPSSPSPLPGRATPNNYSQKLSPGASYSNNAKSLPGVMPYAASMINNLANYASRGNLPMNLPLPNRTSIPHHKDIHPPISIPNNKMSYSKPVTSFTARKPSEFLHGNSSNGRGSGLSTPSPTAAHPRMSPSMLRLSPHHRSTSPAPSPQHMAAASTSSQSKPSVPMYKKQDSKSYSHKFKASSNLAVFNPDPNGFSQKIVIKKLDSQPNNHH